MEPSRRLNLLLAIALLAAAAAPALRAQTLDSDEPRPGEYRVTVFPFHRITDTLTGFGYVGYVWNPDEDYTTEYLGYGMSYTPTHHVQWWGGLVSTATQNEDSADKFELRPFVGLKLFTQNSRRWNLYNYTRWEYRAVENKDADDWSEWSRIRSRFGIEAPLTGAGRAWKPKTWYALADFEAMYRTDHDTWDPLRLRFGIAYIFSDRVRAEFIYHMQWTDQNGSLKFTENIYRLNIKVALTRGILPHVFEGGDPVD